MHESDKATYLTIRAEYEQAIRVLQEEVVSLDAAWKQRLTGELDSQRFRMAIGYRAQNAATRATNMLGVMADGITQSVHEAEDAVFGSQP